MNELDPAILKYDNWIYWTFNNRVYQGRFGSIEGKDVWLYIGLCGTKVAYPLADIKLFKDYPSDVHFGLRKSGNEFIDERVN